MASMMGRLGLSGQSRSPLTPTQSEILQQSNRTQSHSISITSMNISSLTKKMGAGLNTFSGHDDRKIRQISEGKRQISQVLNLLNDVKLQCPPTHLGLVLAYSVTNFSPVIYPGLKFTWFRMSNDDQIDQIAETSTGWYAPTVDDIGCMICVHCEYNYDQCSKYFECGPIKADGLLCSIAESAVDNGMLEIKRTSVSLGIDIASVDNLERKHCSFQSALDESLTFLQLDGHSSIEVDESGIFISIPTIHSTGNLSSMSKSSLKSARRGLRIPSSSEMKVVCVQPSSLILIVPITHKGNSFDNTDTICPGTETPRQRFSTEEDKMNRFLSSSIVVIPWTYEGHNYTPETYIAENFSALSIEEKENLVKIAEEDSIIFANTVCSLAEFISSLPEGTNEMMICFSCCDRTERDAMVMGIRSLACQNLLSTKYERRQIFPWHCKMDSESENLICKVFDQDITRRLRFIEEENSSLIRERNELTFQLFNIREENVALKNSLKLGFSLDSSHLTHENIDDDTSQLPSKVIELENKILISTKRESEAIRIRDEVEFRNNGLLLEIEKFKNDKEKTERKLLSLQSLYDCQVDVIRRLEEEQMVAQNNLESLTSKNCQLREMQIHSGNWEEKMSLVRNSLRISEITVEELQTTNKSLQDHIRNLESKLLNCANESANNETLLKAQLIVTSNDGNLMKKEINLLTEKLAMSENDGQKMKELELKLEQSESNAVKHAGELNSLNHKCDSIARHLKKVMKDNASSLSEFEKALVRKSEECNDLYYKINEMKDLMSLEQSSSSTNMFAKIVSMGKETLSNSSDVHGLKQCQSQQNDTISVSIPSSFSGIFRRNSNSSIN